VLSAVDALRAAGAQVIGVAVIVERGAAPAIAAAGLDYRAAYSPADLGLT
jgi:orotate phosphoribosyltransferase